MYKMFFLVLLVFFFVKPIQCKVHNVGTNSTYQNIQSAPQNTKPGDTILVLAGIYNGGMSIANLQGEALKLIYIIGESEQNVIIRGGTNAIQFSDAAYLIIKGLIFEGQTRNDTGECVMTVGTGRDLSLQRIDISHLPKGVYFVKIGDKYGKFVKE